MIEIKDVLDPTLAPLLKKRMGAVLFKQAQQMAQAEQDAIEAELARQETLRAAKRRVICGAKTRKGKPCRNKSEPGKRRCKFHGGKSTGPKTVEGRARIREAQRSRWARWRIDKVS